MRVESILGALALGMLLSGGTAPGQEPDLPPLPPEISRVQRPAATQPPAPATPRAAPLPATGPNQTAPMPGLPRTSVPPTTPAPAVGQPTPVSPPPSLGETLFPSAMAG